MKYLAAYMLLTLGGYESPSAADVKKVLGSVGIETDSDRLEKLIGDLKGKDLNELTAEGSKKLSSIPSGGVAVSGGSAPAAAAAGDAPAAKEEKKEEKKKEEEKEESDEDMGFGLFD